MTDLSKTIAPRSDQLNADDFLGHGDMTIKITKVSLKAGDQPIAISFEGDNNKPFLPCKSMRRILVHLWGGDGAAYIGRSLTLYRDEKVKFGGSDVGGIRISHMSHITESITVALTVSKAVRKPYTIKPLKAEPAAKAPAKPAAPAKGTISGDANEGDLSGMGTDAPDAPTLQKVVSAYEKIGYDKSYIESEVGKPIDQWSMADLADIRNMYAEKKSEFDSQQKGVI